MESWMRKFTWKYLMVSIIHAEWKQWVILEVEEVIVWAETVTKAVEKEIGQSNGDSRLHKVHCR